MFGYVIANRDALSEDDKTTYREAYCGLCRAIRERHGNLARMTLTYDMTFLILVMDSLYEPKACTQNSRCIAHPLKKQSSRSTEITNYAADMNVALAYLNLMDNWYDDKNIISYLHAKALKKKYNKISKMYPRQVGKMEDCMSALAKYEKSGDNSPDTGANIFGELMAEVFVLYEDRWANILRSMAFSLGRFIYIMDAVIDIEKDIKKNSFNPLLYMYNSGKNDDYFKKILTMIIGDCTIEFEKLPLVDNISIMRNILGSGVWARYEISKAKKQRKKGENQ